MQFRFPISPLFLGLTLLMNVSYPSQGRSQDSPPDDDKFAWLEDVTGEKSLDWVRARNKISHDKLEADVEFSKLEADLLAILDSDARIPMVTKHGDYYYNFWRDKKNPRGLWC